MSDPTVSPEAPANIAQQLGADPAAAAARAPVTGRVYPLSLSKIVSDLTRSHPFAMLGFAFILGAACVGGRRRR